MARTRPVRPRIEAHGLRAVPVDLDTSTLEPQCELLEEALSLRTRVILVAHLTDTHDALTEWGARLYFWARIAYVPLYAAGVPIVRSLVWNVATIGIVLVVVALLWR